MRPKSDVTAGGQRQHAVTEESGHDPKLWREFAEASTSEEFCRSWLALQSSRIAAVRSSVVLLGSADKGPYSPVAVWPDRGRSIQHLTGAAERALRERRGFVINPESSQNQGSAEDAVQIAYPLEVSGQIHGVVILELAPRSAGELQIAMRELHWGASWIEVMIRRTGDAKSAIARDRLQELLDLVAAAIEHERFQSAAMAFATRVARALECERVSVGFRRRNRIHIRALSHSAGFGKHMNVARAIESAMDEAVDQQAVILYPPPEETPRLVTRLHGDLARMEGLAAVCTVPLERKGVICGALTLERIADKPFDDSSIELIKTIAAMAGPILDAKRKEDRLLIVKAAVSAQTLAKNLIGPDHALLKTITGVMTLLVVFFAFAKGDYRVTAPTSLEGTVQRVISAPFNGYVAEAPARPGDVVLRGALMARLDDRDLKLERLRWVTEGEQYAVQYGEALAKHDRAQVGILQAKINQAKAQTELLDEQLSRARIVAPFDSVVTSGDLSQSLGIPVERGQGLFEVAPLGGYRVILQVDERDIARVREKQRGELVLASLSGEHFPLMISQITPVSTQKEGRNYFRVEATLGQHSERLRPGMEGVGKITIDRRKLIWIWTHEVIEWVRLKVWAWWP